MEPAEEIGEGAKRMLQAGALENPKADAFLMFHYAADMTFGMAVHQGQASSMINSMQIHVHGKSSHWCEADKGIDAIYAAAQVISAIHDLNESFGKQHPDAGKYIVGTGTIHGGEYTNIIADHVVLNGNIRAVHEETYMALEHELERNLQEIEKQTGTQIRMEFPKDPVYAFANDEELTETAKVYHVDQAVGMKDEIDVLILCGGSATDLPVQTPEFAQYFNVVDSFDTHARIPEHFANVDAAAKEGGHVGIISVGWDPGMFSLNRLYANAILPDGNDYTFWGKGVSQGHSDAIRRVEGVKDGKQYTIPVEAALEAVRNGENPELTTRQKHTRECFVVLEEGADAAKVEEEIKTMPNYFSDYDTTVHFISEEELKANHSGIPHGGFVLRSGKTGWDGENKHLIEYSLKLDSNPEFTSSVLIAYARAAYRLASEGQSGCKTVFDIAPAYLSAKSGEELRKHML